MPHLMYNVLKTHGGSNSRLHLWTGWVVEEQGITFVIPGGGAQCSSWPGDKIRFRTIWETIQFQVTDSAGQVVNDAVLETKDLAKDLYTSARGTALSFSEASHFWCVKGEFWRFLPPGDHLVKAVSGDKRLQSAELDVKVGRWRFFVALNTL